MNQDIAPPRVIGLPGAVLINLNAVVGAGIFALPALLYAGVGTIAPLIVLAFAVLTAAPLLVAGKLSTLFDQSGGPQLYVERAFGQFAGFQIGWAMAGGNIASRAANFLVLVSYLAAVFPLFDEPVIRLATILALIALVTLLSVIGARRSIDALWVGTALKLGPILLVCLAGLVVNGVPARISLPDFTGIESIALLLAYAYSGGTNSTLAAGEVKDAKRTVYRSIFVNLAVIALLYAFVQWAYIAIDPQNVNPDRPLASAAEAVLGQWGVIAISVAAIFSIGTNQMSYFISFPRMIFGMSQRRLLPGYLARVSPRFLTPANAILTYSALVTLLALSGSFTTLATFMVALERVVLLLMVAALPMLWWRGEVVIGRRGAMGWTGVLLVALAFNFWLLIQVPVESALPTLGVLIAGSVFYFFARRTQTSI